MAVRQPAPLTRPRPISASVPCSSLCFYPCGNAAGRLRAHSPCLSFCSRSGRRTTEGQAAPLASGPWKELLLVLRPTSPHTSEMEPLLAKPLGEHRNPALGVPEPLWTEGIGGRLAGAELSKGVLSSAPSQPLCCDPSGRYERPSTALCRRGLKCLISPFLEGFLLPRGERGPCDEYAHVLWCGRCSKHL